MLPMVSDSFLLLLALFSEVETFVQLIEPPNTNYKKCQIKRLSPVVVWKCAAMKADVIFIVSWSQKPSTYHSIRFRNIFPNNNRVF